MKSKNSIKLMLKMVLVFITILLFALFVTGVDSLLEEGYLIYGVIILLVFTIACFKLVSKEDLDSLTGGKYSNEV